VLSRIREAGIIPVIRAGSSETAERIGAALVKAGLTVLEIAMTVPNAAAAIASAARACDSTVVIGAGTITTPELAEQAIDAGATFLVTPAVLPAAIDAARRRGVPVIAGALTPTEIMAAIDAGADWVKVFPASAVGGPAYLRALRGPFPGLNLVPTGGVHLESVGPYIQAGAAAVGVGGELIRPDAVDRGDYEAIGTLGRRFVAAVQKARAVRS
jgi:2-dehydro-3-deoxyphosphogluconate aldolase/(4S)-4-hydroxy-2-oxoglutarate aldolase